MWLFPTMVLTVSPIYLSLHFPLLLVFLPCHSPTPTDEHTKLITRDSNTLADINTELAKLKLCPVQGTAAVFLEVDAAARLEAHCALTRQKVEAHGDLISTNGKLFFFFFLGVTKSKQKGQRTYLSFFFDVV